MSNLSKTSEDSESQITLDLDQPFSDILCELVTKYVNFTWPTKWESERSKLFKFAWRQIVNPNYIVYDPDTDIDMFYESEGMKENWDNPEVTERRK